MSIAEQDYRIQKAMGNLYCQIYTYEGLGKPVDGQWRLFKILYLMFVISPYVGYSCDFSCWLDANTNC